MRIREVEALLLPKHREAFEKRRALVHKTANKLGLTATNAVIVGGAGLALHGLDSRIRTRHRFDVDAFLSPDKFYDLCAKNVFTNAGNFGLKVDVIRPFSPLSFTGFVDLVMPDLNYDSLSLHCINVDGKPTLPAHDLAAMKLRAGRTKDLAGLVKAHIIGEAQDNPIVEDEHWRQEVGSAVQTLRNNNVAQRGMFNLSVPRWLGVLAQEDFSHPALDSLNREVNMHGGNTK